MKKTTRDPRVKKKQSEPSSGQKRARSKAEAEGYAAALGRRGNTPISRGARKYKEDFEAGYAVGEKEILWSSTGSTPLAPSPARKRL